eukprot:COSAG01_NODE_374_length_17957_cov_51.701590_1_plen_289_part_10
MPRSKRPAHQHQRALDGEALAQRVAAHDAASTEPRHHAPQPSPPRGAAAAVGRRPLLPPDVVGVALGVHDEGHAAGPRHHVPRAVEHGGGGGRGAAGRELPQRPRHPPEPTQLLLGLAGSLGWHAAAAAAAAVVVAEVSRRVLGRRALLVQGLQRRCGRQRCVRCPAFRQPSPGKVALRRLGHVIAARRRRRLLGTHQHLPSPCHMLAQRGGGGGAPLPPILHRRHLLPPVHLDQRLALGASQLRLPRRVQRLRQPPEHPRPPPPQQQQPELQPPQQHARPDQPHLRAR